jgi:hypothetical protein
MIWIDSFWCINDASMMHQLASLFPASSMHRLFAPLHQWCIDYLKETSMMHRLSYPLHQWCIDYPTPRINDASIIRPPHQWCIDSSAPRINDASIISPPRQWCIDNCDLNWCSDASIIFNNRCGPLCATLRASCAYIPIYPIIHSMMPRIRISARWSLTYLIGKFLNQGRQIVS